MDGAKAATADAASGSALTAHRLALDKAGQYN